MIQNDLANRSAIRTVIICVLTTNLRLAKVPGNVLLDTGEAGLQQPSVVNVSQILTVNKSDLTDETYVGTLSLHRVQTIVAGVAAFLRPVRTHQ